MQAYFPEQVLEVRPGKGIMLAAKGQLLYVVQHGAVAVKGAGSRRYPLHRLFIHPRSCRQFVFGSSTWRLPLLQAPPWCWR